LIDKFLTVWKTIPLPEQVGAFVALFLAVVLIAGAPSLWVATWKDDRFDRQIELQKIERTKMLELAKEAEQRALLLEADKAKLELAFDLAGDRARVALQKVDDAEKKYQNDKDHINTLADICERYLELRISLGLPKKECAQTGEP
jgi:hypothetical protein